jgi:hypothetical protein
LREYLLTRARTRERPEVVCHNELYHIRSLARRLPDELLGGHEVKVGHVANCTGAAKASPEPIEITACKGIECNSRPWQVVCIMNRYRLYRLIGDEGAGSRSEKVRTI